MNGIWKIAGVSLLLASCSNSQLPADPTAEVGTQAVACAAWSASAVYNGGDTVTFEGATYKANWWTQGNNPASSSGPVGSGQPWTKVGGSCGGTAPPAPNPDPTTSTPNTGCTAQVWTRGVNYSLGTIVKFEPNGKYYALVNVGANGSDGTDPTISTWYWRPVECPDGGDNPPPPTNPTPGNFVVSEAQYNQMFPNRIPYYSYAGFVGALEAWPAFATSGSDTVKRQEAAAFLANMHHESGGGVYVREINRANWPLYCSLGVGNCGGKEYYGRGPTQLSWDYNYRAAGQALGIDLINNPDLVADDATVGWKTALWYWMTQSAQAARTSHDAMVQGAGFGETIRAINGGLECNGAGETQRNTRINLYREFTGILGVPTGDNLGC